MSLVRKRLLFVDDEPGIRQTLPVILRKYGLAVTVTASVSEAIEEITKQSFDLLLCDLNLEREHDGFEVVRAIRKAHPNAVVIVLTAYPDVDSAIQGIREQIDDYVVKPSNPDTLVTILANNLAKRKGDNHAIKGHHSPFADRRDEDESCKF
jgi:DNA-binding NtrC family response regulator